MGLTERALSIRRKKELRGYLRRLAKWRNNDAVKLAALGTEDAEAIERLDLYGVSELKKSANGAFEAKFVDRLKVLEMLRELAEEENGNELEAMLDELRQDGEDVQA